MGYPSKHDTLRINNSFYILPHHLQVSFNNYYHCSVNLPENKQ